VAANLDQLYLVPEGRAAYVTCGDDDSRAYAGRPPGALERARAFFLNKREALGLTGEATVEDAAKRLAESAETVVVTLAGKGAIACSGGELSTADVETVDEPADTTGAGDLLVAAYAWADLAGAEPEDRLRWGVLFASLAVTQPTGIGGAVTEAELLEAGTARGLAPPPLLGARQA
jgi:sugar/nucleoside kinase (ribokinase family)